MTIIGNISGVSPTATEIAKSAACIQLPFVKPLSSSTRGTIATINRINSRETAPIPLSKAVLAGFSSSVRAMLPNIVSPPTASTTARALPLITLLP